MENTFGIWCEVWGGVTGHRTAWLKSNGELVKFSTREEAEKEAADYQNNRSHGRASFSYTARQIIDQNLV